MLGQPGTVLIVAPHSDDETIGAFGLIGTLRRAGVRVRVIVVSDGAASHPGSVRWPRERLICARVLETRRAMRRAGLHAGAIEYLGLPDGALTGLGSRGWRPLARAVRRRRGRGPLLIVGPSPDEAHADHVGVAHALARIPAGRARRLAYCVWPSQSARPSGRACGLAVAGGAPMKRSVLGVYRTQTGAISDSPTGFAMSRAQRARFSRPLERFEAAR